MATRKKQAAKAAAKSLGQIAYEAHSGYAENRGVVIGWNRVTDKNRWELAAEAVKDKIEAEAANG